MESDHKNAAALNRFLREYLADRDRGRVLELAVYQGRYPGHEELVAREFERLQEGGTAATEPGPEGELQLPYPLSTRELGAYRLERELGRGGQGVVYLARDTRLGRSVAIKVLSGLASLSPEHLERFHREAALAGRLDHPGICAVYESDTLAGVPYVAMRHVPGETLAARLARAREGHAPVDVDWAVSFLERAARALHAAHEGGVIHRDVKPSNLMVTPAGEPVVLDFGVARELEGGTALTRSDGPFGTPGYMAPEQIHGRWRADRRTDVYALGATLYEALTLSPPFRAPTREALYMKILSERQDDPRALNARVPKDLRVVLETALEKEPDRRYQTGLALAEDLAAVRESRPIAARPVGPVGRAVRWARREPRQAALSAGVVAALVLAAGFAGYLARRAPELQAGARVLAEREREQLIAATFEGKFSAIGDESLNRALAADPADGAVRHSLALLHFLRGERAEALALVEAAPEDSREARTLARMRAAILRALDRGPEADRLEAELGEPGEAMECWWVARNTPRQGESREASERALALVERAVYLSDRPQQNFLLDQVRMALSLGDFASARRGAEALERHFPDSAMAWWTISMEREMLGDQEGVLAALARSVELEPDNPACLTTYAGKLVTTGDPARARELFDRAIAHTIGGPRERRHLRLAFAGTLEQAGLIDEALAELDRALEEEPDEPLLLARKGALLVRLERDGQARPLLEAAVARDPDSEVALGALAQVLARAGELERAQEAFERALENLPDLEPGRWQKLHFAFAEALTVAGRGEQGLAVLDRVLERYPDHVATLANQALVLRALGRVDEARAIVEALVAREPDNAGLRALLEQL